MRGKVALLALAGICAVAAAPAAADAARTSFELRPGTHAEVLAAGPDGNLWFGGIAYSGNPATSVVGRITPDGEVDEYLLPGRGSTELGIGSIAPGPEGQLWFTEPAANRIDRVSTSGQVEGFTLPIPDSRPQGIASGLGGYLWATEEATGKVVRIDPAGTLQEHSLAAGARPGDIVLGADEALWVTEVGSRTLARVTPEGTSSEYPLPNQGTLNSGIALGADGSLWVSQEDGPWVGQVVPTQGNPEYVRRPLPGAAGTTAIVAGPRGDLWYADSGGRIGSISTAGDVGEPACASTACQWPVTVLAKGPNGGLWYATGLVVEPGGGGSALYDLNLPGIVGRFTPPALSIGIGRAAGRLSGRRTSLRVDCSGGAAGQRCAGAVRILAKLGGGRGPRTVLGHRRYGLTAQTGSNLKLTLTSAAAAAIVRRGRLRARVVATLGGKSAASGYVVLRAAR